MHSNEIFGLIESIAATSSKNEKVALLAKHHEDSDLRRVLSYALSPGRTYGIRKRPDASASGQAHFDDSTWQLLDDLASRKASGHLAIESVRGEMERLSAESSELFWRIVATDLRAGFSASTVNKAIAGLIVEYPYMRCSVLKKSNFKRWNWQRGVYSQIKANGLFASLNFHIDGEVEILTRQGTSFPLEQFQDLINEVRSTLVPGMQYHGEFVAMKDAKIMPRQEGNGILNSVAKGGAFPEGVSVTYLLWDRVPLAAVVPKGRHDEPYRERFAHVEALLSKPHCSFLHLIETRVVYSLAQAYEHYKDALARGEEGTVNKSGDAVWRDGTSVDQAKLKIEADCDLRIVAIVPGKDGKKNAGRAGSLTCETECKRLRVDVTVKNDAMRDAIDAAPHDWLGKIMPVLFNEICEPSKSNPLHSLYLPRFDLPTYRADKLVADDLQRVYDQFESAKLAAILDAIADLPEAA